MRTISAAFDAAKSKTRGPVAWIAHFNDGTSDYYFSTRPIAMTDITVLPLLTSTVYVRKKVDVFTKKTSNSDVKLAIDNGQRQIVSSDGSLHRLSDVLGELFGKTLTMYLHVGEQINTLADCLTYFVGTINAEPSYDEKTINITARDIIYDIDRMLPQRMLSDEYSQLPERSRERKIPIVYGAFTISGSETETFSLDGNGLAKCEWVSPEKVVVSDHELYSFSALWHRDSGLIDPCLCISPTLNTADGGLGTAEFSYLDSVYAYIHCVYAEESLDYRALAHAAVNPDNAMDRDASSYATLRDDDFDNGSTRGTHTLWVVDQDSWIVGIITSDAFKEIAVQARAVRDYTLTLGELWMWYGYYVHEEATVTFPATNSFITGVVAAPDLDVKTQPVAAGVRMETAAVCDSVRNNASMAKLYDVRFRVKYQPEHLLNDRFAECYGRKYGSWITESGRSIDSLTPGDCIQSPAHIVESILRDELGLSTADIDTDSFDAVYVSSLYTARMQINSDNQMTALSAIEQLCEQWPMMLIWSGDSKARMVNLFANPSNPRLIRLGHVVDEHVVVDNTTWIVNKLTAYSRYQREYNNKFRDVELVENTTSQTANKVREATARWYNISGNAVTRMKSHLLATGSEAIWARKHPLIKFATFGAVTADLELGDGVYFDHTEMNDRITLPQGESWEDVVFMIVDSNQREDRTEISAINLYV